MSVESMGLTLVTKQTSGGGETVIVAVLVLATEGLDVRINVLAVIWR